MNALTRIIDRLFLNRQIPLARYLAERNQIAQRRPAAGVTCAAHPSEQAYSLAPDGTPRCTACHAAAHGIDA